MRTDELAAWALEYGVDILIAPSDESDLLPSRIEDLSEAEPESRDE